MGDLRGRGETYGMDLTHNDVKRLYSKELRSLVMECMMREPTSRPTSVELQNRVRQGLSTALKIATRTGLFTENAGMRDVPMVGMDWPPSPTFANNRPPSPQPPAPTSANNRPLSPQATHPLNSDAAGTTGPVPAPDMGNVAH